MRAMAAWLGLVLLLGAPAIGATYYVDVTNGNDTTGDGSIGTPWQTMGKAEEEATGGDTVYLRAGTYPRFTMDPLLTERTDWLTWKAYPGESVVIEGLTLNKYWSQAAWEYDAYMAFEDLEVYEDTGDVHVISISGPQYVAFRSCELHGEIGEVGSGAVIYSRAARYITVEDCHLHDAGVGFQLRAWDVNVLRCELNHFMQDGIQVINAKTVLIEDCEIHDITDDTDEGWHNDGIQMWSTGSGEESGAEVTYQDVTVRRCHVYDFRDQGMMLNGNKSATSWPYAHDILVENCLFGTCPTTAFEVNCEYTVDVTIRNCTFPNGVLYFTNYSTCDVRNTICQTLSVNTGLGASCDYNDYNLVTGSVSGVTAGAHTVIGRDPQFVDAAGGDAGDYHLQPTSPAIDSGVTTDAPSTDLDGLPRIDTAGAPNQGGGDATYWDIGCFEYYGAAGGDKCATVSETHSNLGSGSGTVTVTAEGYYELVMKENQGGKIAQFYDLTADPGKTRNLTVDSPWTAGLFDARYLTGGYSLHYNHPTGRTLSVEYADERRVVVKCVGVLTTDIPFEVYYTFHAPVYEGSFIDVEVFLTNNTSATVSAWYPYFYMRVAADPTGYTFDWQGSGTAESEPTDRWVQAVVGSSCTVPDVTVGRTFRLTELTTSGAGASPGTTPPGLWMRASPRDIAAGATLYDHLVVKVDILADVRLWATQDNLNTGSGTLTVTCPHYWELVMNESTGSGLRQLYDLRVDPLRQTNLANPITWAAPLFDVRVAYSQSLHTGRGSANRIVVTTEDDDEVVARVTGTIDRSGLILDFTCDYCFLPPTSTDTEFGIELVVTNNSGGTVPASYDFVNLTVANDPTGYTFDWQGSVDSDADNHWLKCAVGASATVTPLDGDQFVRLQELSYGNISATDSTPPTINFKFPTATMPDGTSFTRDFVLNVNIPLE